MMQTYKTEDNIHKAWLYRVLESIADNTYLSQVLYFKGGTCASMLGWLDRFSVDLDFDYVGDVSDIEKVRKELESVFTNLGLRIKDKSKTGIQYFLKYEHTGRNTLKIDVLFPVHKSNTYIPQKFLEIDRVLNCQSKETMFSHKLCALMDRYAKTKNIAGRDLYDIHHFFMQKHRYSEEIIFERTGLYPKDFFKELYDFIEIHVTDKIITEDLSALVEYKKFTQIKKFLKKEVLMFVSGEIDMLG